MNKKLIYNFTPDGTCVECCPNCGDEIEECRLDGTTTCECGHPEVLPCSDCKLLDFEAEVQREMYLNSEDQSYIRGLFPDEPDSMICCDWDRETRCTVFPKEVA